MITPYTIPYYKEYAYYNSPWFRGDSQERYWQNINAGKKIPYNGIDITYKFNDHGFRCDRFSRLKKKETPRISFIGCSIMQGYGLPDNRTIPGHVAIELGYDDCWNLGIAGASNDLLARTAISTSEILKPDIIVVLWTYFSRREIYDPLGNPIQWIKNWRKQTVPPEFPQIMESYDEIYNEQENLNRTAKNITLVNEYTKNRKIKLISMFVSLPGTTNDKAAILNLASPITNKTLADFYTDVSRDLTHPGKNTTYSISSVICSAIRR